MKHWIALLLALTLFGFAAYAGDNPAVGKWECTSVSETGVAVKWILVVKEAGGKLDASLTDDGGHEAPGLDPKLDGNVFTFKIKVNAEETVDVTTRIEGNKLDGSFKGRQAGTGTFKGTKQRS